MGDTKTYEDWSKYLGVKPHRLGVVARMYTDNTLNFITDGLRNVFYKDEKASTYELSSSLLFEWEVETNNIKKVEFAEVPTETGENGSEITMAFKENYYQKYDIFRIDKTKQQCQVVSRPIRKHDMYWEVQVRLIDNDYDTILDTDGCQIGDTTTFQSVAVPELSEEGYSKFQSQMERHRNFITTFRADASWSSLYAIQENVFMSIADDKDATKSEGVYKMLKKEKELLDTFMYAMNTGLLLNKGNIDINGKATISEPETGRPIYIGEGFIPQVEAAANKYCYSNKPNLQLFNLIMNDMADKAQSDTGNKWVFVVNRKLWQDINMVLGEYLANYKTMGTYMYSKAANKGQGGYVKVGATFDTYEYAGNQVSFVVDRALTREYPDKGYGVCIDLTADKTTGTPAVAKFTLTGKDFITNKVLGVGGYDGKSSGEVASNVAGSKLVMMGYAGIAAFTPHRSVILREA
nr:MAG TPA: major capsid protein [Caudoviricetes sp.]